MSFIRLHLPVILRILASILPLIMGTTLQLLGVALRCFTVYRLPDSIIALSMVLIAVGLGLGIKLLLELYSAAEEWAENISRDERRNIDESE